MKPLELLELEDNLIPFEVSHIKSSETLWINAEYVDVQHPDAEEMTQKKRFEKFKSDYGYGVANAEFLSEVEFDHNQKAILLAERYGGKGVATNGGGARAGLLGNVSLKGVGPNCLAGKSQDKVHSYGGLDAPYAVIETIYANLIDTLLPLGAVRVLGLIYTGEGTATDTGNRPCWGVIMVREQCIRPGHFLRSGHFNPTEEFTSAHISDVARVRKLSKSLKKSFGSDEHFIRYLGQFLSKYANQFAFAKVMRIMHGTITPSNISIDGRWLDLPFVSMLSSGINYAKTSAFYEEPMLALEIVTEFLATYSKYNNIDLNPAPLVNYYSAQFEAYSSYHLRFVFALEATSNEFLLKTSPWKRLFSITMTIINSGTEKVSEWSEAQQDDPLIMLLNNLFMSINNKAEATSELATLFTKLGIEAAPAQIIRDFNAISQNAYTASKKHFENVNEYRLVQMLVVMKRAICAEYFYLINVDKNVRHVCDHKTPNEIAPLIEEAQLVSNWVFEAENKEKITLFNSAEITIFYDLQRSLFIVCCIKANKENDQQTFETFNSLMNFIQTLKKSDLEISNYPFIKYFNNIASLLSAITRADLND
jgi:hypothetical protein